MIEGLVIRCDIGPVELFRSPLIELVSRRRAVVSRAKVVIPDPEGACRNALAVDQKVVIRFGYRGESGFEQEWRGTIESISQPRADDASADAIVVNAIGLEKALVTTMVRESFRKEPCEAVARRLLAASGLPVGEVDVPVDVLPWQVFSNVSVARAVKQLANTLERSFGHDMSRHALWLGEKGVSWSAGDEPGNVFAITTAENLLANTPPLTENGVGVATSVLLPGLAHSRLVHITDTRRGLDITARALDVVHTISEKDGNHTTVTYGKDVGWS
ncbi:MAG: hypothetical protein K1W05_08335 [Desulfovibrio sp.]